MNGNGLVDFHEFKELMAKHDPEMAESDYLDIFEHAIHASADQLGEDTDEITIEAFVASVSELGLVPSADTFVDPRRLLLLLPPPSLPLLLPPPPLLLLSLSMLLLPPPSLPLQQLLPPPLLPPSLLLIPDHS